MPFGMPRNANRSNSIFFQKTGLEKLQAAMELSCRLGNVAGDDKNLRNARIAGEPCEKFLKRKKAFDTTGNHVRHGFHTLPAQAYGKRNQFMKIGVWSVRDIQARAGSDNVGKSFDAFRLVSSRLDRIVSNEILNGNFVQSAPRHSNLYLRVAPADDHRDRPEFRNLRQPQAVHSGSGRRKFKRSVRTNSGFQTADNRPRQFNFGGSQTSARQTRNLAPDMRKEMYVHASVDEADIGLITEAKKKVLPVSFTVDAYPDDLFTGSGESVAALRQVFAAQAH